MVTEEELFENVNGRRMDHRFIGIHVLLLTKSELAWDMINELVHEISNKLVGATSIASDQPAHAQSDQSLCLSLEYSMIVKLLAENHLEFLSLKGGCSGSSTLVKMSNCWKSHALAQFSVEELTQTFL